MIMTSPKSSLRLYISNNYDMNKMPGYVTIPFNFEFKHFNNFFHSNLDEILKIKRIVSKIC